MSDAVERFRKRRAILVDKSVLNEIPGGIQLPQVGEESCRGPLGAYLEDRWAYVPKEAEALLAELHGRIDAERMGLLLDSCRRECVQAIIRPLGVGRVLFQDKDGGNVDTIHNVRNGVWATQAEKKKYERRDPYSKVERKYRNDNVFTETRTKCQNEQKAGKLENPFGSGNYSLSDPVEVDHMVSCKEIHDDAGRFLADLGELSDGLSLARTESNLNPMHKGANRSKGKRTALETAKRWDSKSQENQLRIEELNAKIDLGQITANEEKELQFRNAIANTDADKLKDADKRARADINRKINKSYYGGRKFAYAVSRTSVVEGGKMGLQQAVGVLMVEFVHAAFDELTDIWKNGFQGGVDTSSLQSLKTRLERIARRVQEKWRDAVIAFKDGAISGFLSNILTVAINIFVTTAAKWVRIIREGFMSLYQAFKMLAFPPEGMTLAEAAHDATKVLAAGLITGLAVLAEEVVEKALLAALGPLAVAAPYVTPVVLGVITGLASAFVVYLIDHIDLFGVKGKQRHEEVMTRLNAMITSDYERGMQAAKLIEEATSFQNEYKPA